MRSVLLLAALFFLSFPAGTHAQAPAPAVEARALWVSRYEYDDSARVARIMDRAAEAGFNLVFFQVRGMADALYRSEIEPCAVALCGRLGGTPSWDPLEVAVREAHARGLQLHAWMNALSGWAASGPWVCGLLAESAPGNPRHLLLDHPEWASYGRGGARMGCPTSREYIYLSPANAGVREQLARVTADVARRYNVDGIHLDHIRYAGPEFSYDPTSLREWERVRATDPAYTFDQFRRDQVTATVRGVRRALDGVRPEVVLSAAIWGIYDDRWGWKSTRGVSQFFQDPRAWAAEGILDVAVPMTYYQVNRRYCGWADWACLADDHLRGIQRETGRPVFLGISAQYGAAEVVREIRMAREKGAAGVAIFSVANIERNGLWKTLRDGPFRTPARVPEMKPAALSRVVKGGAGPSGAPHTQSRETDDGKPE